MLHNQLGTWVHQMKFCKSLNEKTTSKELIYIFLNSCMIILVLKRGTYLCTIA